MDVPARIDHTVLGPTTTDEAVLSCLDEAIEHGMNACVPPCHVDLATNYAPDTTVATVVGFPHGQHETGVKVAEAEQARTDGADELDVVANAGLLKAGADDAYRRDIAETVAAVSAPVKVIVEAPLLTDAELDRACELAADADADILKTATGFADGGATVSAVERMAAHRPVKASGGIGSWERAEAMFDAGAERIGASSGATIAREWREATDGV
ncbi:deoxyribose-phosphate aldolase [Halorientalis litorea]|jgi:deoxyribose-phosphate aldolase|uniref:deoxyribose-phosphate aldolase n=1 Tax=Halorientalis litorea TaxID=2931977 RepID=UPI001FF65447|nr:deoxyribose-phosphate aldolase [Halorientalis litorea]